MALSFTKVEGLGNDFILLDWRHYASEQEWPLSRTALAARASHWCDRRLGVGADGILILGASSDPQAAGFMHVINADGSQPEMCGNGLRCAALQVFLSTQQTAFPLETGDGIKVCKIEAQSKENQGQPSHLVQIDMGKARFVDEYCSPAYPEFRWINVSTGNPHAIHFVETSTSDRSLLRKELHHLATSIGPKIEKDTHYPEGTNVELACLRDNAIELVVWERGSGLTQACGTGACATVAAARHAEWAAASEGPVAVHLPGGTLSIQLFESQASGEESKNHVSVQMTGPARVAFQGTLPL